MNKNNVENILNEQNITLESIDRIHSFARLHEAENAAKQLFNTCDRYTYLREYICYQSDVINLLIEAYNRLKDNS